MGADRTLRHFQIVRTLHSNQIIYYNVEVSLSFVHVSWYVGFYRSLTHTCARSRHSICHTTKRRREMNEAVPSHHTHTHQTAHKKGKTKKTAYAQNINIFIMSPSELCPFCLYTNTYKYEWINKKYEGPKSNMNSLDKRFTSNYSSNPF